MASRRKHPYLTNVEFAELGRYIRWVANELGLRDWTFDLKYEPPQCGGENGDHENTDAAASVEVIYGKKRAAVRVGREFYVADRDRQRQFIVHELIHCHIDNMDTLTQNEMKTHLGEVYWQAWHPGFNLALEQAVDALADAFAPHMPLIKWPDKSQKRKSGRSRRR